jgi:hypothetical protein
MTHGDAVTGLDDVIILGHGRRHFCTTLVSMPSS